MTFHGMAGGKVGRLVSQLDTLFDKWYKEQTWFLDNMIIVQFGNLVDQFKISCYYLQSENKTLRRQFTFQLFWVEITLQDTTPVSQCGLLLVW